MRVAFDLDDTLISNTFSEVEIPKHRLLAQLLNTEKLRKGTIEIFQFCKSQDWETWVYTTSFRHQWYVKKIFWLHGIYLDGFVNQNIHNQYVKVKSSKYPPTFGIDILIDDSKGVAIEGERYHFKVILVSPTNQFWVADLKEKLRNLKS